MAEILVVDDQKTIRNMFKAIIDSTSHNADYAIDGIEGYNAAKNKAYDLIFVDMSMPNMDGLELTEKLRKLSKYAGVPIFIVSSSNSGDRRLAAKKAGISGWVVKPVIPDKILKLLNQALD